MVLLGIKYLIIHIIYSNAASLEKRMDCFARKTRCAEAMEPTSQTIYWCLNEANLSQAALANPPIECFEKNNSQEKKRGPSCTTNTITNRRSEKNVEERKVFLVADPYRIVIFS